MTKKVLITSRSFGQVSDEPNEILKGNNIEAHFNNNPFDEKKFEEEIDQYDGLVIGAHKITRDQMKKAKKLKIIAKHGAGLDNIDLEAAKDMGIKVTNTPGTNSNAVADVAFGLIIDSARKISKGAKDVKAGNWERIIGVDVYGKTLGLVGFGAIAKNVAKRAKGFDMKVYAYDPFIKEAGKEYEYVKLATFEEVIKKADFLSVHVPLNDKTKNLINKEVMLKMKKGSYIINTSRGGTVNEAHLYEMIKDGQIAGAGLDVTEKEPPDKSPLLTLDNVTITPHIGMYSIEAINAVSTICAHNVANLFNNKDLINVVI